MKMKKFIASVLVAATAFGLVACGNSGSGDSAKSDSSAKSTDKKEIVYGGGSVSLIANIIWLLRDHIQSFLKMPLFRFLKKRDTQ